MRTVHAHMIHYILQHSYYYSTIDITIKEEPFEQESLELIKS